MAENEIILGEDVDLADWPVRGPWGILTLVRWLKKQEKRVGEKQAQTCQQRAALWNPKRGGPKTNDKCDEVQEGLGGWALVDHWRPLRDHLQVTTRGD